MLTDKLNGCLIYYRPTFLVRPLQLWLIMWQNLLLSCNYISCWFVCNRGDTIKYHGRLRSREFYQAPLLQMFLTPMQALSSHPRQQMVWLYWVQDRDSMPNWRTINHPTTLQTHNETQWPTVSRRWHFALQDVSILYAKLSSLDALDIYAPLIFLDRQKTNAWSMLKDFS